MIDLVFAALGGGAAGAIGVALVKRLQARDALEAQDLSALRAQLWERVRVLEARCDAQAEAIQELVVDLARYKAKYTSSEARVVELESEVVELKLRLDPPTCA